MKSGERGGESGEQKGVREVERESGEVRIVGSGERVERSKEETTNGPQHT